MADITIGTTVSITSTNRRRQSYSGVVTGFYEYGLFVDTGEIEPTCFSWSANTISAVARQKV